MEASKTESVRISKKAVRVAKRNKKKTGIPIGKFIEEAIFATEKKAVSFDYTPMSKEDVIAKPQKINFKSTM